MATVYIAAPYELREEAQAAMHALTARGHHVTSQWLRIHDTLTDAHARKDLRDIHAATVLLVLNPEPFRQAGTGGRHVELGYALAHGKRIIVVGPRTNIFHYLYEVEQSDTLDDALDRLEVGPSLATQLRRRGTCPTCLYGCGEHASNCAVHPFE